MRKTILTLLAVLLAASAADARYCVRDDVPAAALLVPYAHVGVDPATNAVDPGGATTIVRITNVGRNARIVHLTVWDMFAQPVTSFDVVLAGYDMVQVNLRDVLDGRLDLIAAPPDWSDDPSYGTRFTSPLQEPGVDYAPEELGPDGRGVIPGKTLQYPEDRSVVASASYPGCAGRFPYTDLSASFACVRDKLRWPLLTVRDTPAIQTKDPGPLEGNWLAPQTIALDRLTFYVTAEAVRDCTSLFADDAAYWGYRLPYVANALVGHVVLLDARNNESEAMAAVAIEGDVDGTPSWAWHDRYARPAGARSSYEPLPTAFAIPYENRAEETPIGVRSNLLVFRTRTDFVRETTAPAGCGYERRQRYERIDSENGYLFYAWDADELPVGRMPDMECPVAPCAPFGPVNVMPFATQRVPIDSANFNLPNGTGWMLLVLPASQSAEGYAPASEARAGADGSRFPPVDNQSGAMGWAAVQLAMRTAGASTGYSAIVEATTMGNRHCNPADVLRALNVYDGAQ